MLTKVGPRWSLRSMNFKSGTKGAVVVAVVVSDVFLEMVLRASERTADRPYLYGNLGESKGR